MKLKTAIFGATAAAALAFSSAAMAAAPSGPLVVNTFMPGTSNANGSFTNKFGSPFGPSLTATLEGDFTTKNENFEDIYEFQLPQNGTGSGNLSTSFTAPTNEVTVSSVTITNGAGFDHSYAVTDGTFSTSGIPIFKGDTNKIEVFGYTSPGTTGADFIGGATFTAASATPEPATWGLMILGLGFTGAMLRRRSGALQLV